jgi:hypothetical protein
MYSIGHILKSIREDKNIALQDVQLASQINYSLLSRIENGERLPTLEQIEKLASIYDFDKKRLLLEFESDKIVKSIQHSEFAEETLKIAKNKILYGDKYISVFQNTIYSNSISLESRRYIGNKTKLTDWIFNTIEKECSDVQSFCDIFAGTGTVSKQAIKRYNKVFINDFLYSNNIIYKAFFGKGLWDEEKLGNIINYYNSLNPNDLQENYFSKNFGGKYYSHNVAKQIGYIRQNIEDLRYQITEKEYNILLATLIYNIDRIANTVGHFDAYIKKDIKEKPLQLRLIEAENFKNVEIFREDANILAQNISADLVYIDPPYNSRQYCRFYHLYETLVKWDKPQLYGVALKPKPENMSLYCSTKAVNVFEKLIYSLNTKYLVVSYNNTYQSKSKSSENKIKLSQIETILSNCGETKVFERSHQFFNTGKTEFNNHKELLFITKKYQ